MTISNDPGLELSRLRGSGPPIKYEDGWLSISHEVIFLESRYYVHRFIRFDQDFNITHISRTFYFLEKGIEFCSGLCCSHKDGEIIIGFGFKDKEAKIMRLNEDVIETMLIPIEEYL